MVYEFAAKIKNITNEELLDSDALNVAIANIHAKIGRLENIRAMFDKQPGRDVLIKAQASVTSFSPLHDAELEATVALYLEFLREIEKAVGGQINENEAFYHNNKTFSKLYW